MNRLQKMISVAVMGLSLLGGMSALVASAQTTPLGVSDLGADQAGPLKYTGLTASADVRVTIARIIRVAMGLLGIIAVVIILIGGFTWMTAGGNDEKVGEAKKWIFSGIIGLAIILSAYAIASFVINQLVAATSTPATP